MVDNFVKVRKNDLQELTGWDLLVYSMLNKNYDSCNDVHAYNEAMLLDYLNVQYKKNNSPREKSKVRKSLETLSGLGYISVEKKTDFFLVKIANIDKDYVLLSEKACYKIVHSPYDLKTKQSMVKVFLCVSALRARDSKFPSLNTIVQEVNLNKNTVIRTKKILQELKMI